MRDPTHTDSSPSPSPYPVSIRAYKKKDYDYLSSFSRMSPSLLRPARYDRELLQDRSDSESDLSMTASSVGYATSISSASTTSSSQSYAKNLIAAMNAEAHHHHHHHQQKQHRPHGPSILTCSQSPPRISADCAKPGIEMKKDTVDDRASADVKNDTLNSAGDAPGPIDDMASAQVKVPVRSKSKPKPRPSNTPAVLPKFGSWDTRNPSSGEPYTLIFRRLRDEKKSGGLSMSTSSTHSKEEGPEECLPQESKPKERLHSNARLQKESLRRKAKGKPHQEAAYNQKHATRWSLCCKASVVDD